MCEGGGRKTESGGKEWRETEREAGRGRETWSGGSIGREWRLEE